MHNGAKMQQGKKNVARGSKGVFGALNSAAGTTSAIGAAGAKERPLTSLHSVSFLRILQRLHIVCYGYINEMVFKLLKVLKILKDENSICNFPKKCGICLLSVFSKLS